jgi:hypothetical protein
MIQKNRLTESQKVQLATLASKELSIADLCRKIGCKSYDVVWRFCVKNDLPYKLRTDRRQKSHKQAEGYFDVNNLMPGYTWLI